MNPHRLYIFLQHISLHKRACRQIVRCVLHHCKLHGIRLYCMLRMTCIRFPEMCLSLTLVNVPPPTEWVIITKQSSYILHDIHRLRSTFNAFDGILKDWCYTTDLDAFFHVGKESVHFIAGPVSVCISDSPS